MTDIHHFSRNLSRLFQVCFIITPIFTLSYWIFLEPALIVGMNPFGVPTGHLTLNKVSKILGFSASLLPTLVAMSLFYHLTRLFKNYQEGQVFTPDNIGSLGKLGKCLFLLAVANFVCGGLISVALTFQNPAGERMLMLSLGSPQVLPILIGLVIMGISQGMKEGLILVEEQRYTI